MRAIQTIEVTGRVPDVRPWLWESAVGIAPLQVARGVQNKALEAIAAGLPIVITPAVAEGLPAEAAPAVSVAGTPRRIRGACRVVAVDVAAGSPLESRTRESQRAALGQHLESAWKLLEIAATSK